MPDEGCDNCPGGLPLDSVSRDEIREIVASGTLSREEVEEITRRVIHDELTPAIREAMSAELRTLGVNAADPFEAQADAAFVRKLRKYSDKIAQRVVQTLVGTALTAMVALLVIGFVSWLRGKLEGRS